MGLIQGVNVRQMFDVIVEPMGARLAALLEALMRVSSAIVVVVQDQLGLKQTGAALIARLEPHLLDRKRAASWPGTVLVGHLATVLRFAANEAVLREISTATRALYSWRQPALPEDLSFVHEDGTAIFTSIAHEKEAYFKLTDEEYESLARTLPWFSGLVRLRPTDGDRD